MSSSELHHYGVRDNTLRWIKSFPSHRNQQFLVEGNSSNSSLVTSDVPHGSVVGHLFFLLYIHVSNRRQHQPDRGRPETSSKGDYKTTSSTSQMIHALDWKTLLKRLAKAKLVMVYRIVHALIDIPSLLFQPVSLNTRGNSNQIRQIG